MNIVDERCLRGGDILLCYSSDMKGINEYVSDGYSHVAIVLGDGEVVEANSSGVVKTTISNLCDDYGHIAVLRSENSWCSARLKHLKDFTDSVIGVKFNDKGMKGIPLLKAEQESYAMDRLHRFFDEAYSPKSNLRSEYFCSEFVAAAVCSVGIIGECASIFVSPDTLTPEDIGKDKTFGFFIGYIKSYPEYEVPKDDRFQTSI